MTKIIVFGANGMLGNYIYKYFRQKYSIIKIDRTMLDASDATYDNILSLLSKYSEDNIPSNSCNTIVINCIGMIPQRNGLDQIKEYIKVNTLFPQLLACCCSKMNYKLIHITTDCVFSGNKGNYSEDDAHDETNIYGTTKSLGEPSNCCVIRTSIIGEEIHNKKSLLEWVLGQNNTKINGFANHYWNGVTCLQLAKIIGFMIENNKFWNGVRHIYSPNSVSKYELVKIITEVYKLNIIIDKIDAKYTNKTLVSKYPVIVDIPNIYEQIKEMQKFNIYE